jgi:hypothetical protein
VGQAARQQLLDSAAQATDDAASLLGASVLQLISSCHATCSPGGFLEVVRQPHCPALFVCCLELHKLTIGGTRPSHAGWSCAQVLKDAGALLGLAAAINIPSMLGSICDAMNLVQHEVLPAGCLLVAEVTIPATDQQPVAVHCRCALRRCRGLPVPQ